MTLEEAKKTWVAEFVERLGLPSVLLVAVGYFGYQSVIAPMAETYRKSIERVADEVIANDEKDNQRVQEIVNRMERIETKMDELLLRINK